MKKERAEKELIKVREQLSQLLKREEELETIIREADKEEAAVIMEKYKISVGELLDLVKEKEAENKRILKQEKEQLQDEEIIETQSTDVPGTVGHTL